MRTLIVCATVLASAASLTATPAFADGPLSLYAGTQSIAPQSQGGAGSPIVDVAAGYDLGPKTIVPLRVRLDADGAFASSAVGGGFNQFGFGADVRLTTPLYAGFGATLDYVSLPRQSFACPGAVGGGVIGCGSMPATSTFGVGTRLFVGARLLQAPGFRLDVEGSYKTVPTLDGIDASGLGIGLRATL